MLLELILLSELLKTPSGKFTSFFGRDTEKETSIVVPVEPKHTGTITQPVIIPPIAPDQFNQWYLDAIEDIPITSLPYTGKR
jgi:hypothetical protein